MELCFHVLNAVKATKSVDGLRVIPNLTIKDSEGQTVLGLTLWTKRHDIAELLISAGANVNDIDRDGHTLLHQAILRHDVDSSLFLLQHQSDFTARFGSIPVLSPVDFCFQSSTRHNYTLVNRGAYELECTTAHAVCILFAEHGMYVACRV